MNAGPQDRTSQDRRRDGQREGPRTGRLPGGVTLREMTAADIPAVHELERRLFPVDAWPLQMFVDELAQAETRRYVVAERPGIVGYAGLMCIQPIADVQTIAVMPEQEGKGIGSALLTELIRESRLRRAEDVLLEVRADNPRAQQLYRRYGFEQIHVRPRYYRDGVDALIMRLRLDAPRTTSAHAQGSRPPMNSTQHEGPLVLGIESSCDETGVGHCPRDAAADQHGVLLHGGTRPVWRCDPRDRLPRPPGRLRPHPREALAEAGVTLEDIDAIAVTSGPGSPEP